ncbi:MAG TPA: choice-of-anchor D domain-containing protein [Candidatus Acidoferrum sp.]|nr:choice-of-anchor D domain-containing protein [Candidatus Acidoferrum sp.]
MGPVCITICALLACFLALTPERAEAAAGTLTFSPSAANFGNVQSGTSKSISVVVTNTGTASVVFSKESLQANMYAVSGLTMPLTLAPAAHVTITVKFSPQTTGAIGGRIVFGSNATNSLVYFPLSGTGVAGALSITPGAANFGSVAVGTTNSQTEQLKNTLGVPITISGATLSGGAQFKVCNWSYPVTLGAGQTANCTFSFSATTVGSAAGSVIFLATPGGSVTVPMTGTGVSGTRTISAVPATLNFGSVSIGKTETLPVRIENTGNSSITVSGIGVSAADIQTSGGVNGATIAPGQSATLDVTFAPTKTETLSGSVRLTSSATNSPTTITIGGAGVVSAAHSVELNWAASISPGVAGYHVYRATMPGGAFSQLSGVLVTGTTYTDSSVAARGSYAYEVKAVSTQGVESAPSAAVTATIP